MSLTHYNHVYIYNHNHASLLKKNMTYRGFP